MQILSFIPQSSLPKLFFNHDRINGKYLEFNPNNYYHLKQRYSERIQSVIDYTENDKLCRQVQLLMYFNEIDYTNCGHCDICINNRQKDLEKIKQQIIQVLTNNLYSLEQLNSHMKNFPYGKVPILYLKNNHGKRICNIDSWYILLTNAIFYFAISLALTIPYFIVNFTSVKN